MAESNTQRVEWIDALKGLAILMVVAVHVSQCLPIPRWAHLAASFGAMGVQLFFLLSAYCLCMTCKENPVSWIWWWRKYVRLASWYLAAIALYWLYHELSGDGLVANYTILNIIANVLLLNGFVPSAQNSIVPGGWSISCIALFVFIYPAIRRLHSQTLISVGVAGCAVSVAGYLCCGWTRFYTYCNPFNQFIVFALGVCLYRWREHIGFRTSTIMAFVFFIAAVVAVIFGREWNILYRHVLMALSFFGVTGLLMRVNFSWGG